MEENMLTAPWNECTDIGLTEKTMELLKQHDIETLADFSLASTDDITELRKAGLTMGQANRLKSLVKTYFIPIQADQINCQTANTATNHENNSQGRATSTINHLIQEDFIPNNANNQENNDDNTHKLNIKDIRANPLEDAGKLFDYLLQKQSNPGLDPIIHAGGSDINTMTEEMSRGTVKKAGTNVRPDDPRAILIMRASNNKTVHITTFLSEETKKRLRNKRQQYLVQQGENLTMAIKDEHPYAGISILEYGAANMRLLNYLLNTGKLDRDKIEYYLAYTTLIFELGEKYEWRDVLNFDFQYRERQAEMGFDWGSMVLVMELQLLAGHRNKTYMPQDKFKGNFNKNKQKQEICRNYANHGECGYGERCKFKHIRPGTSRISQNNNGTQHTPGLLQNPTQPQRSQYNNAN